MIAVVGVMMTACHHDEKKTDDTTTTTDTTTVVAAPKPEEKHEEKEEPKEHDKTPEHHKDTTLKVEHGAPIIKDTAVLQEKPKDETNIGGANKKHVKPGGIKGTK